MNEFEKLTLLYKYHLTEYVSESPRISASELETLVFDEYDFNDAIRDIALECVGRTQDEINHYLSEQFIDKLQWSYDKLERLHILSENTYDSRHVTTLDEVLAESDDYTRYDNMVKRGLSELLEARYLQGMCDFSDRLSCGDIHFLDVKTTLDELEKYCLSHLDYTSKKYQAAEHFINDSRHRITQYEGGDPNAFDDYYKVHKENICELMERRHTIFDFAKAVLMAFVNLITLQPQMPYLSRVISGEKAKSVGVDLINTGKSLSSLSEPEPESLSFESVN